ncbi:MAG TPA: alpha-2-macroglobulin family protein [Pyrinomonadaceae bacterium]|nr:alpha-2-macroglobulin family protein [Pyrinomonadaceae bacterium]
MKHLRLILSLSLIFFIFAGSLPQSSAVVTASDQGVEDSTEEAAKQGLQFRLSEGKGQDEGRPAATSTPAQTARLSESEIQNVLKRLPAVKAEEGDEQDFAMRDKSLPAPRTGKTINVSFPSSEAAPTPVASVGPLEVLRFSPEGDVPLAPQLSITFSQPMVAVTSNDELAAGAVPVQLTPQPAGKWRWVGTKTLLFVPDGRFAMATTYSATVPAGTKSANGGTLQAAKTWTFVTPPPQVKSSYPNSYTPVARDALMFLEFDQRINPAAVLSTIKVSGNTGALKLRLATEAEIAADKVVSQLAKGAESGRWLAFRAITDTGETGTALPADSPLSVVIGPGTPSAEGPRTTASAQSYSFRTYGAFRVTGHRCSYNETCTPFDSWMISFTNPLDAQSFDLSQIRVEPEVKGLKASVYGDTLYIEGAKRGRTTYKVTLSRSLKDQFGQTLGSDVSVTFNVGPAPPSLVSTGKAFVVLDPNAPRTFSVYSVNFKTLRVRLYKVAPEDWEKFTHYMRFTYDYYEDVKQKQSMPPGLLVSNRTVAVKGVPDEVTETRLDLTPALNDGLGQVVVIVEAGLGVKKRDRQSVEAWVQSTNIGLSAFVDNLDLYAWTTSLKEGKPLSGVELRIHPLGVTGQSGMYGIARLPLKQLEKQGSGLLIARSGRDVAILPEQSEWWSTGTSWYRREDVDSLRWFVFDDRKMYRPGEEVHIKGWIRTIGGGKTGDVEMAGAGAGRTVNYTLMDSRGNEITKGSAPINALGGFDTKFKLPATMNLGNAYVQFDAPNATVTGGSTQHYFQVQEFRRPEFEVGTQASEGPYFVKGFAQTTVTAAYYAGGGLPNAPVTWRVTSTPTNYTPPNRGDYTFGEWVPWWRYWNTPDQSHTETFSGKTDAAGKHQLRIDFDSVNPPRASNVTAQASVVDVNRQQWASTTNLLVHPADLYVGLRAPRTFVQQGEPLVVETIVTDLDGKIILNRDIRMRAVLLDWVYEKGQWKQKETNAQDCNVKSAADAVRCTFTPQLGGTYRVTARILDDRERPNQSALTLWVAGGKQPPKRDVEQEAVDMIPDRKEYKAGDIAEILVQSPFYPAEGVLTLRRSGILKTERFQMDGPSHTIRIPIEEAYTPNLHVQVDLTGAAARTNDQGQADAKLPKRPAFAKGELNLLIPPVARKLTVSASPRDAALEPGTETVVNVEVRDAAGQPVAGSEVALVVVDEAVLALTGYRIGDPLYTFYSQRDAAASDYHLRANVLLGNPEDVVKMMQQQGQGAVAGRTANMAMLSEAPAPPPVRPAAKRVAGLMQDADVMTREEGESGKPGEPNIRMRENFNALAVFAPTVPTDASGRATVTVKVPDNLTRYRVMAVSVAGGKQFGSGESVITARLPLMARPSAPRFLNFGDRFELPVVVQNQTDQPMRVDVAVRATNAELTDGAGRRVTVPANDRVEVRLPAAANRAGTARFQVGIVSGRWTDAAEISLPVWTPATTEAFATYGEIDDSTPVIQPVRAPANVFKQFGGLEITTSSTQLQALTDAVLYLMAYPYECSEQLSSRILAVAALRDVLSAFKTKDMPKPEEMLKAVSRDIERLKGRQTADGGFGFWRRDDLVFPYVSIHVAHSLQRAKEKNFPVPPEMLEKSKRYLREIEKHIPSYYGPRARWALISYALYVRNRMGDRDTAKARKLIAEAGLEMLSLESVGWLLSVLSGDASSQNEVTAIRRHLNNRATETAATAHFADSYDDGDYLLFNSNRRADGIILEALIGDQQSSDLIPKIVRGLLAHRKQGRWENTQENVFILLALDRYFNVYEKATPDFVAKAWLGDQFAGQQQFRGRSTDRQQVNVPMRYLAEKEGTQNLALTKEGTGRLYYRIGMQYAPTNLQLKAADYGFTVERTYEAIDDPADVRRAADGTWHIKSGATVRVHLTMAAPSRRYHVALVDPLPAGLEAMNPALAVTGSVPQDQNPQTERRGYWWWMGTWYEHQNLRDERAEAFASLLWEGVYNYSYVARATTPGTFVVPPTKAEEMYHPETFGRSQSDRVVIE